MNIVSTVRNTVSSPVYKKQKKMSLTQTYYLAHSARGKLSKEASRADHDLRLLVGHANLLDSLMLDLAEAEREQESWFNQTVKGATKASEEPKHIQWADAIPEESEESWDADSSEDESEYDEDEDVPMSAPLRRVPSPAATVTTTEVEMSDEEDDEEDEDLSLTRTSSHPPELLLESDSESEDDSMPPSPPQTEMPLEAFSEKQRQAIATTSFYSQESSESDITSIPQSDAFYNEGYYLPQRSQAVVSAY